MSLGPLNCINSRDKEGG